MYKVIFLKIAINKKLLIFSGIFEQFFLLFENLRNIEKMLITFSFMYRHYILQKSKKFNFFQNFNFWADCKKATFSKSLIKTKIFLNKNFANFF